MNQRIIFQNDEGGISILTPAPECLESHSIEEIAAKDVPAGKPYKIVSIDDIPSDRTFRNAWTVNEAELTDGVGAESNMFSNDPQHPDYVAPVIEEQA